MRSLRVRQGQRGGLGDRPGTSPGANPVPQLGNVGAADRAVVPVTGRRMRMAVALEDRFVALVACGARSSRHWCPPFGIRSEILHSVARKNVVLYGWGAEGSAV